MIFETSDILLEAPNWSLQGDALIVNGNGKLWRLPVEAPELMLIDIDGVPSLNNDHVLDPDGVHIFVSAYDDWQIYRAPLSGGRAVQITGVEGPEGLLHFLHGVSPDGQQLAFVGVEAEAADGACVSFRRKFATFLQTVATFARLRIPASRLTGRNTARTARGSISIRKPSRKSRRSPACGQMGPKPSG